MNKLVSFAIVAILLSGCESSPESVSMSTNPKVTVETLFSNDGCTIYRFRDGGTRHYYSKCGTGIETETISVISCGKNCIKDENIK